MGLDSVEIVLEWEKYFEIKIPDIEVGEISTVQDAVNCISKWITFDDRNVDHKQHLFVLFITVISELNASLSGISADQKIFALIPFEDRESWEKIAEKIIYELPYPMLKGNFGKFMENVFPPKIDFQNTSVDRFIDLIFAVNYKKILGKAQLQNRYEVLIATMGITINLAGVNPFEVFENSSFVNDLGIN